MIRDTLQVEEDGGSCISVVDFAIEDGGLVVEVTHGGVCVFRQVLDTKEVLWLIAHMKRVVPGDGE